MNIPTGQIPGVAQDPLSTAGSRTTQTRAAAAAESAAITRKAEAQASDSAAKPIIPGTDVTVRRDNNGRVYYVVSNANSGQEILEIPPKALRDVSQGIEDYLKQEQAKASAHIEVKA